MRENNVIFKNIDFFLYKRKHLFIYVIIGFLSIVLEIQIRSFLILLKSHLFIIYTVPIIIGILFAFFLNIKINFNVNKFFFYRSLIYFFIISVSSYLFQSLIRNLNYFENLSFENSRYLISGIFFLIGYFLHTKFSFKESRKVGVAIYANNEEDFQAIFDKIGDYPDFIHIDIIDKTMLVNAPDINTNVIKKIKSLWPKQEIHTHIMSKFPLKLINESMKYSSIIYFQYECDEDHKEIIKKITNARIKVGIVLHAKNEYNNLNEILSKYNEILVLCIDKPGYSGQEFLPEAIKLINNINNYSNRKKIKLCIDGGIRSYHQSQFSCEKIVSASDVLMNKNPKKQIMKLQTLSRYEK